MFLRIILSILVSIEFLSGQSTADDWTVYEKCEFQEDEYYDGDSFKLKAPTGHIYIFRLYGVDSPETDDRYPDRIKEQAKDFEIAEKRVLYWGERARKFTRKFLKGGKIVAHTKKVKAGTQSSKNRYFAVIEVDGERLDEALVAAGLARAYGAPAEYPDNISERTFLSRLRRAESEAKKEKLGIWGEPASR